MSLQVQAYAKQVIALTRDVDDSEAFAALEALGWRLVRMPLTMQVPGDGARLLPERMRALGPDEELVFTSANAVFATRDALDAVQAWPFEIRARIWVVGPATAEAVRRMLQVEPSLMADEASANGLLALAADIGVAGRSFLFPAAAGARRTLPDGLRHLGAAVDEVTCYATIDHPDSAASLRAAIDEGLDLVTLASPSAVSSLMRACAAMNRDPATLTVAAIGPTTAEAAREAGLTVSIVATEYTMPGLARAIITATGGGNPRDNA